MPRQRRTIQGRIVYDRKKHRFEPKDLYRLLRAFSYEQGERDPEEAAEFFSQVLAELATGIILLYSYTLRIHVYDPVRLVGLIADFIGTLGAGLGEVIRQQIDQRLIPAIFKALGLVKEVSLPKEE